jgi:hypothetical protein
LLSEDQYALEFEANGTLLRVAIVPGFKPYPFTALGWNLYDIAAEIAREGHLCAIIFDGKFSGNLDLQRSVAYPGF